MNCSIYKQNELKHELFNGFTLKEKIKFKVENSLVVGWLVGNIIGSSIHDLNQDTKMQVPTNGY
jgi:hypothetical protein